MPKHRAQRPGEGSDRRVPIHDAMAAVKTALARNRPGAEHVASMTAIDDVPTTPLPAVDEFTARPGVRGGLPRGWLSGSLVNPWFAAATGLVIAAGLWLYSPHKAMTYLPNMTAPATRCETQGCTARDPSHRSLATRGPSQRIRPARHSHPRSRSAAVVRANRQHLVVHLVVIRHDRNGFVAEVTLRSRHKLGSWRLAFSLPRAQIYRVMGAQWQPAGQHGGIASGADPQGHGWPYGGHHHGRHGSGDLSGRVAQFWIVGSGSTAGASGCKFDGQRCVFS